LEKLSAEGKTMLISTHDVNFVYRWAERVIVFSQGRLIADGTPLEIFQNKEVLEQANLKQPTLMEVYDVLVANRILDDRQAYPKNMEAFKLLFY
jgi:cobalt/nickel transport system ATP-binding protein